ncbi:MAG TPA: hypothetical protein VFR48_06980 [Solirubrobacteraceae bacterium]|nr:hypothetical protein [Solirubrobacteraceae bacterium]
MAIRLAASITAAMMCAVLVACGTSTATDPTKLPASRLTDVIMGTGTAPLAAPKQPGINDTYDEDDSAARALEQGDDGEVEYYARPSTAVEWRRATAFVRTFFQLAVAEDGAKVCARMTPALRASLGGGKFTNNTQPRYESGSTCAQVMKKVFEHDHDELQAKLAGLEITDVRTSDATTFVLLAFKGIRERREMGLNKIGRTLQYEALTDSQYP